MAATPCHYRTLGVAPAAADGEIRAAYLTLMRRFHPDRGGEEADASKAQMVAAAYDVLRHPARRAAYDAMQKRSGGVRAAPPAVVADLRQVRGGAAARNIVLMLAAATLGLAFWGFQMPPADPKERHASVPDEAPSNAVGVSSQPPQADRAAQVPGEIAAPITDEPSSTAVAAPMAATPRPSTVRGKITAPSTTTPAPSPAITIDLADLERHLQLLTDQSVRVGTDGKRERLFASREVFLAELNACPTDICRRDAYLRRNEEVAAIMRD